MDQSLLAWARAVKRRSRTPHPVLWLFTDAARGVDPLRAAARLPKGLCGVVFRHDQTPDRAAIGRELAKICRARRLTLVVAGDVRLAQALGAGVHLRGGHWPGPQGSELRRRRPITSSAHALTDIRRAEQAGARVIFLSPVFPTASHPGAPSLGTLRWATLARPTLARPTLARPTLARSVQKAAILALGGVTGRVARALPREICRGAGAIGALGG